MRNEEEVFRQIFFRICQPGRMPNQCNRQKYIEDDYIANQTQDAIPDTAVDSYQFVEGIDSLEKSLDSSLLETGCNYSWDNDPCH